jgi:hypothetical protein
VSARPIVFLTLIAAAAACSSSPGPQGTGIINGTVTAGGTTALAGVTVTAAPSGGQRAIVLDPNDVSAHLWYSQLLQTLGREREQLQPTVRSRSRMSDWACC